MVHTKLDHNDSFLNQSGLAYVRGCEVEGMLDDRGNLIDERKEEFFHCTKIFQIFFSWTRKLKL